MLPCLFTVFALLIPSGGSGYSYYAAFEWGLIFYLVIGMALAL